MCVSCVSQNIKELERETERGISGRADHNRGHQLQNAFVTADAANGRGTPGQGQAEQLHLLLSSCYDFFSNRSIVLVVVVHG